jgi:cysteine desulfurase/selenocysteine lyase
MGMAQPKNQSFDMSVYRDDFPILSGKMNGKPLAYLDSASSAQKPRVVLDAMKNLYEGQYANIHRGLYQFSQETTTAFEAVRGKVAAFINTPSADEIIFTRNTTEAINLVAQSWAKQNLKRDDEIIISEMEHHANIVPWQLLAKEIDFKIKVVPDIKVLIDGSQSVVHHQVDVQEMSCDFFAFTGHKIYGPNGVGALWVRGDVLADMPPYQGGGDMIERVSFKGETSFKDGAARFEAGTPAIAEVIALGAAIDYVADIGMDNIAAHEQELLTQMTQGLQVIDGLKFYGTAPDKVGVVSFTADWAHISDIAMILDQCGVAVRTGHHCCMPLMERFGIDGTVRASLGLYSNSDDVQALLDGVKKAKEMLS